MKQPPSDNKTIGNIYSLLSMSMRYPEPEWFSPEFFKAFVRFLSETDFMTEAMEIVSVATPFDAFLEDLQVEYTRLFINAMPSCPAPPFGSVYMEGGRSLYGTSTEKVLDFYRENGFEPVSREAVPDELTIELEFLGLLAENRKTRAEEEFLSTLFRPWFSKFSAVVIKEAKHPFYRIVVQVIDAFTKN